jgi:hypothetical protein
MLKKMALTGGLFYGCLTFQSCGFVVGEALNQASECYAGNMKSEGQNVFLCSSNLGVSSWHHLFACTEPGFFGQVSNNNNGFDAPPMIVNCVDDRGNISNPPHTFVYISCSSHNEGKWLSVSGFAYQENEYFPLHNNYWFQCNPNRLFPRPAKEDASGSPQKNQPDYVACRKDQRLETNQVGKPNCVHRNKLEGSVK